MIRPLIKPLVSIAIPLWMALSLVSVQAQSSLGTLHGVTANADGTPIASAQVVIHRSDDNTDLTVISGFDGAFAVSNLKPGRYEVKASKGELHSPPATVDLAAQQDLKSGSRAGQRARPISVRPSPRSWRQWRPWRQMEARIEQLEAELKSKSVRQEQPITPAPRGDLVATLTKDPSQIPIVPATLGKPDMSKAVASAASRSSGQERSTRIGSRRPSGGGSANPVCLRRLYLDERHATQQGRGTRHAVLYSRNSFRHELHQRFQPADRSYDGRIHRGVSATANFR